MATNREVVYPGVGPAISRVRWGAVIAGVLIAIVTQWLLSLFGLAVGLTAFTPGQPLTSLGIGSGVWLVISTLISVFLGAWATSWFATALYRADGILHGILTWCLFMVITLFLIGSGVGNLVGGAFNLISSAVTGASQGVATEATKPGGTTGLQQRIGQMVPQQGMQPGERLTAAEVEQAADVAASVAWWGFIALLLSLIAGALGGLVGTRSVRRTV